MVKKVLVGDDYQVAELRHVMERVANMERNIRTLMSGRGRDVRPEDTIIGVADGEITARSGTQLGTGDMTVYPVSGTGEAQTHTRTQKVYNLTDSAIATGTYVKAVRHFQSRIFIVEGGTAEEWEVGDLEAESDIQHTQATEYGTTTGQLKLDPAGNLVLNSFLDVLLQSNGTTIIDIDKAATTITFGTGANTIVFNWTTGIWQPAVGVLGQVQRLSKLFTFSDFNQAQMAVTFDTTHDLPDGALVLGATVDITTLFGGGGATSATLTYGPNNSGDAWGNRDVLNGSGSTGTLGTGGNGNNGGSGSFPFYNETGSSQNIELELTCDVNCSTLTQGAGDAVVWILR